MSETENILAAWQANSDSWIEAINRQELASRALATNAAIVNAINKQNPKSLLDLGCGEGWLCRALSAPNRRIIGIDGVQALVTDAQAKDATNTYYCFDYNAIRQGALAHLGQFDVISFNFALFEETGMIALLEEVAKLLSPNGKLIFQTVTLGPEEPSSWHREDWQALDRDFPAPFPWYYRTEKDWQLTLQKAGWALERTDRTLHPKTKADLSIIIQASVQVT